ncbi:pilus assembly protein [Ramlibacter tataouinensis]|uniref:TadE/TadG family type IV pilus assembly protein n=1 Tax=Ramlibacter tataouinensis TaxID=94132 RepID=UPI0022F39659|nr:TadE family protein [Ramlibacter tataouinensis]WBY02603.1 pilus assembly protein [Ramlibacter tataouinensis]
MTSVRMKSQCGVAIIEFALVVPVLVLLSMLAVEFGRAMYQYDALTKSVRDAARYLSIQLPGANIAEARNLVVYGNLAGSGSPLLPGLTPAHVPDPTWQNVGADPIIRTVTIQVSGYTFDPLVTTAFGFTFPALTFSDIRATMRSHQ